MRVLLFHGYLLRGTGSNIYTGSLARALVALGHEVHLICQERRAAELEWVDAVGDWSAGSLEIRARRQSAPDSYRPRRSQSLTVYLPDIGGILPVYVEDRYEGFDARAFPRLSESELASYIEANVAAVREVVSVARPDVALANHVLPGPLILSRALPRELPYAVKVHGSALEYTVRPHSERFLDSAAEGLRAARAVLVGSRHTAESLWRTLEQPGLAAKTRLGPPGVDTGAFRPRAPEQAAEALSALRDRLRGVRLPFGGEPGASEALGSLEPGRQRIVTYVGKLLVSKGVDLLLAAWPIVAARIPDARLCIVGFGAYRGGVERLLDALGRGDLADMRAIAARGRELEGGPPGELRHLLGFLERLEGGRREAYVAAAPDAAARVCVTGRLEHEDLPDLLGACQAQVVPSTFPEAFGMVAAEAAACGLLPVSAAHSGLAEVSATLRPALQGTLGELLSFPSGSIDGLAENLLRWLELDPRERGQASSALAARARELYGWDRVAEGVLDAARGRLDRLEPVAADAAPPVAGGG